MILHIFLFYMNGFIDILISNVILATKYIYYIYNIIYIDFFNPTAFENFVSRERRLEKNYTVWV